MRLPKWKRKKIVRINGQNREDAYSSNVRQRKRIETREKALRTHSHHPNLRNEFDGEKKRQEEKIALRFLFCFVLCIVLVWCPFGAGFFGTVGETAYQLGLHFICVWLKEEQNKSQTEKVKEIAGAYFDRINRIWSSGEVDRTRNSSKWSSCRRRDAWKQPRSTRFCLSATIATATMARRRRQNYYAFNNKAPQIKGMAKNAPSLCALGNWFTFLNTYTMHTAAVNSVRFDFIYFFATNIDPSIDFEFSDGGVMQPNRSAVFNSANCKRILIVRCGCSKWLRPRRFKLIFFCFICSRQPL